MKINHLVSEERIIEAAEADEYLGICLACGSFAHNVEPDAENYRCEACGEREVMGVEILLHLIAV